MNAHKSLGGVVRSTWTWYVVVITCKGRHWSNCQHELTHVAETMKLTAGLEALHKWGARWGHVPKAQGLKRRGQGPRPCNKEGARGGWQTDRQTDFPPII